MLSLAAVLAAGFGSMITLAQQQLSSPARDLRRRVVAVQGVAQRRDGSTTPLDKEAMLAPLESALRTLCRGVPLLALALVAARFAHF